MSRPRTTRAKGSKSPARLTGFKPNLNPVQDDRCLGVEGLRSACQSMENLPSEYAMKGVDRDTELRSFVPSSVLPRSPIRQRSKELTTEIDWQSPDEKSIPKEPEAIISDPTTDDIYPGNDRNIARPYISGQSNDLQTLAEAKELSIPIERSNLYVSKCMKGIGVCDPAEIIKNVNNLLQDIPGDISVNDIHFSWIGQTLTLQTNFTQPMDYSTIIPNVDSNLKEKQPIIPAEKRKNDSSDKTNKTKVMKISGIKKGSEKKITFAIDLDLHKDNITPSLLDKGDPVLILKAIGKFRLASMTVNCNSLKIDEQ